MVADLLEILRRHRAGIKDLAFGAAPVGMDFQPVVVGPHEGELQARVVLGLQETQVNRPIEKRAVVVVIPIEDERIDAVVGGGGDFLCHDLRVGFIGVSPERHVRLVMAGEARAGCLDQFPLGPILALALHVARIARVVVAEVVTRHGDRRFRTRRPLASRPTRRMSSSWTTIETLSRPGVALAAWNAMMMRRACGNLLARRASVAARRKNRRPPVPRSCRPASPRSGPHRASTVRKHQTSAPRRRLCPGRRHSGGRSPAWRDCRLAASRLACRGWHRCCPSRSSPWAGRHTSRRCRASGHRDR